MKLPEQKRIQMVWVLKDFFKNPVQKTGELFNLSRNQWSILQVCYQDTAILKDTRLNWGW